MPLTQKNAPTSLVLFVSDCLDMSRKEATSWLECAMRSSSSTSWGEALFAEPVLNENLAFYDAWKSLFNIGSSKLDFANYQKRLAILGVIGKHQQVHPRVQAFVDTILKDSHAVMMLEANGNEKIRVAANVFQQKLMTSMSNNNIVDKLLEKLSDRYDSPKMTREESKKVVASLQDLGQIIKFLLMTYQTMRCTEYIDQLEGLEAWARATRHPEALGIAGKRKPSLMDVAHRVRESLKVMRLPHVCPLSGFDVHHEDTDVITGKWEEYDVSIKEAFRHAILRNLFIWRTDRGGTLVHISSAAAASSDSRLSEIIKKVNNARLRTISHISLDMLLSLLPRGMYSRVISISASAQTGAAVIECWSLPMESSANLESRWTCSHDIVKNVACVDDQHRWWLPDLQKEGEREDELRGGLFAVMVDAILDQRTPIGMLLQQQLTAQLAQLRGILDSSNSNRDKNGNSSTRPYQIVAIDTRANMWTALSVLLALEHMDHSDSWGVTICCMKKDQEFYERVIRDRIKDENTEAFTIRLLSESMFGGKFDMERYNILMKSVDFWRPWKDGGTKRVLIVQDDGILARRGLAQDQEALSAAYLGAPWGQGRNAELESMVPSLVGNGGLSLRDPAVMYDICRAMEREAPKLFNRNMQPVPEDVFFAQNIPKYVKSFDSQKQRRIANKFAFEETPPPDSTANDALPYGLHKPWPYMPLSVVKTLFQRYLS